MEMNSRHVRRIVFGIWTAVFLMLCAFAFVLHMQFASPVPHIIVHSGYAHDLTKNGEPTNKLDRPGTFEIVRVIEVKRRWYRPFQKRAYGHITAYFERRPNTDPVLTPDGREARADRTSSRIGEDHESLLFGQPYRRVTIWETPRNLPPGLYQYVAIALFCNAMNVCEDYAFPPVMVELTAKNWPPGEGGL